MLSPVQTAVSLGVSVRTLERWREAGTGPGFVKTAADKIAYPLDELINWLADQIVFPENPLPEQARRSLRTKWREAAAL